MLPARNYSDSCRRPSRSWPWLFWVRPATSCRISYTLHAEIEAASRCRQHHRRTSLALPLLVRHRFAQMTSWICCCVSAAAASSSASPRHHAFRRRKNWLRRCSKPCVTQTALRIGSKFCHFSSRVSECQVGMDASVTCQASRRKLTRRSPVFLPAVISRRRRNL